MKKNSITIVLMLIFSACITRVETANDKETGSEVIGVEVAKEWLLKGREALKGENYDEAVECFQKAIAIKPNDAKAYYNLGIAYSEKGLLDEAMAEFKKAISINPNFAEAHNNLGTVYGKRGMIDEEISEYEKAIALNPNLAEPHNNLGFVYSEKGMLDEAISEYRKAIALDRNNELALYNLAIAYTAMRNHPDAIDALKQIIAINPDNADAHYDLGVFYHRIEYNDSLAANHFYKAGLLYFKEGDRKDALAAYDGLKETNSKELEKALFEKLYPEQEQKKSEPPR